MRRKGTRAPYVYTAAAMQTVRDMAADNKAPGEIAAVIGSTPSTVVVMCHRYRIPLGRMRYVGTRINDDVLYALQLEAKRRHMGVGQLVRLVLMTMTKDQLFYAVLGAPQRRNRKPATECNAAP
jgi:hypothetical protein